MRKKLTKNLYVSLLCATLEENGYQAEMDDSGYIRALGDHDNLLIFPVCRCLSDKKEPETTMIHAKSTSVDKLVNSAEKQADDFIPCIGFGIGKYSYTDSEICIIPLSVWKERAQCGYIVSFSSDKYYYDYGKNKKNSLSGVILKTLWKGEKQ